MEDIEAKQKSDIRWKEYLAANHICLGMELEVKRINYSWCKSITPELKYPKEVTCKVKQCRYWTNVFIFAVYSSYANLRSIC